ncbi:MAG: hypothetical protein KJN85_01330, partial [Maribacter sp.]|nr:hypothetical protein [Maribacter sp.]
AIPTSSYNSTYDSLWHHPPFTGTDFIRWKYLTLSNSSDSGEDNLRFGQSTITQLIRGGCYNVLYAPDLQVGIIVEPIGEYFKSNTQCK